MTAHVIVEARCMVDTPHELDVQVAGFYLFEVDDDVPDNQLANAALDAFHGKLAIKVIDDFEYYVFNRDGNELQPDPDVEDMSLESYASLVDIGSSMEELGGHRPAGPGL